MDTLRQDLRFAMRVLARRRTFTVVAIATLALGIGAATTIFTVVDAVVLRPLAYRESDRLVMVTRTFPDWRNDPVLARGWADINFTYPEYREWRAMQRSFEDLGIWVSTLAVLSGSGDPEEVRVSYVSASLPRVRRCLADSRWCGAARFSARRPSGEPRVFSSGRAAPVRHAAKQSQLHSHRAAEA